MKHLRRHGLLGGIVLLGAALRSVFISSRSIQYDDAFSYFLAKQNPFSIITGTAADTMPPLYYFLLHFWLKISTEIWFLRLLSILLSLGILLLVYRLTTDLISQRAGLWAAFFTAISPLQIYHAQDLRMYALLALSQLGYLWFFIRLDRTEGRIHLKDWLGFVVCGAAAMYSHNLAVFGLVAPNLYLLLRRRWRLLGQLLIAQVLIGLVFTPWLLYLPGQLEKIQRAFWTPRPGFLEVAQALIVFTTNLPLKGIWLGVGAVISLQIFLMIGIETWRGRKSWQGEGLLLLVFLVPPALLFTASLLMRPVFVPRGFLISSLAYYALAGAVIARTRVKGLGIVLVGLFIAAAAIALPYQLSYREFPRSPYQEAMTQIQDQLQSGDVIVHDNKLSYFPSLYYTPELPQVFLADEAGSSNDTLAPATQEAMGIFPAKDMNTAVKTSPRVFFVVFQETIEEYQAMSIEKHPQIQWLDEHYRFERELNFNDLNVYLYAH